MTSPTPLDMRRVHALGIANRIVLAQRLGENLPLWRPALDGQASPAAVDEDPWDQWTGVSASDAWATRSRPEVLAT